MNEELNERLKELFSEDIMKKEEINASTKAKVAKIEALMKELQITATPEEVVSEGGLIRRVVYYMDHEQYAVDIPSV